MLWVLMAGGHGCSLLTMGFDHSPGPMRAVYPEAL